MSSVFDLSIKEYLAQLGSQSPAPGGGCAASLTAAQGVALFSMVASLTSKSPRAEELKTICDELSVKFQSLGDLDVKVFSAVMAAMKLPKATDEEAKIRKETLAASLKEAALAPLAVVELCLHSIPYAEELLEIGNKNVVSDIGVGLYLIDSAAKSSKLNVLINLKYLKDEEFVSETFKSVETVTFDLGREVSRLAKIVEAAISPSKK